MDTSEAGRLGGLARKRNRTKEELSEMGRNAQAARKNRRGRYSKKPEVQ